MAQMKYLLVVLSLISLTVQAQTVITTTQIIREETTMVIVSQNGNTATQSSVPIVYKCNGQTCVRP